MTIAAGKWRCIVFGCGSLMLIGLLVFLVMSWWGIDRARQFASDLEENPVLAARMLIAAMPGLEEVECNEADGTMTLRNKDTGEEFTVGLNAITEGRLSFSNDRGDFVVEDADGVVNITSNSAKLSFVTGDRTAREIPDWVPIVESLQLEGQHALEHDTGSSGGFNGLIEDTVEDVAAYYNHRLTELGFEVIPTVFSNTEIPAVLLTAENKSTQRLVIVNITSEDSKTRVGLTFNEGSP